MFTVTPDSPPPISVSPYPRVFPSRRLRVFFSVFLFTLLLITPGPTCAGKKDAPNALGVLAYIRSGDLWVRSLPRGPARRLTFDADNSVPRWSPSGQWLAFQKGRSQVWIIRNDGTAAHPVHDGVDLGPWAWSSGSDLMTYVVRGGLWRVNADDSDPMLLIPHAAIEGGVEDFFWNPDGTWVVYKYSQKRHVAVEEWPWRDEVGRISADGFVRVVLAGIPETQRDRNSGEEGFRPGPPVLVGWAGEVLFWQGGMVSASLLNDGVPLYAIPLRGGRPRMLAGDMLLYPDFWDRSPNGEELAITEGGGRETWSRKRIVVVRLGPVAKMVLTDEKTAAFSPVFSPDGLEIAYAAGPDSGDSDSPWTDGGKVLVQRRIWIMGNDGSSKRQLTNDADYRDERPLWSKDGTFILFGRIRARDFEPGEACFGAGLWLVPAQGGEPIEVADRLSVSTEGWYGYYGHMAWDNYFSWWQGPPPTSGAETIRPIAKAAFVLLFVIAGGLIAWRR